MKKILGFVFLMMLSVLLFTKDSTKAKPAIENEGMPTAGTYAFDKAHSFIGFRVKHLGLIDVSGYFRDFTGTINYDEKDITKSSVEFSAAVASIDTGVAARDNHLRSADFFEVEKYPQLTFKSTKVEKKGNGYIITGDLTIKGVTKQISFPFEITGFIANDPRSGGRMGVAAETVINRRDFGINYGGNLPNGTPMIGDEVKVSLQIEAIKPKAEQK
ncbi:MAG: polyisoprenoid-binding protein [Acidobacteria bacterium]|jgi:polyisoprenoid-binding protein YceI|nr:MAG: polyisoprenoid-binding protein [Acidobacteriota bacterium]GIU80962.1 MAG: polyisoprenoid-binding protein [Pyrinomonadaceae bacterium]